MYSLQGLDIETCTFVIPDYIVKSSGYKWPNKSEYFPKIFLQSFLCCLGVLKATTTTTTTAKHIKIKGPNLLGPVCLCKTFFSLPLARNLFCFHRFTFQISKYSFLNTIPQRPVMADKRNSHNYYCNE